ncbi:DUF2780 domain-containing protein [Methylomicrobium sp. Wu6]|uniref:DUF2780 domain-containing protein n=1 Tax=Methylomicrobium sp. Wu6 TaxID=3107928 RepID=UPI002DD6A18C|nr:DUF2780 domain-containing protein [Methylomicrobium sp. Wu6]MEC4748871.1 DUF2780 domain-containing protein [Methylomicrobium sp. Wu6]
MKSLKRMKIAPLLISIVFAGCAGSSGQNVIGTVDSGLATVGRTAQTGRAVIEAGKAAAAGVPVTQTGLTNALVNQLGVSPQQALGGAGAIFQAAKVKMAPEAFSSLSQTVPGVSDMLAAAPQVSQPLSGATSVLGGVGSTVNTMTSLAASFQRLNLSPSMVNQFIPVVVDYVRNTGGPMSATLFQSALTAP